MIKDEKQTMLSKGKTPKGKILGFDGQKSPTPLENLRSLTGRAGFTMLELLIVIAIIGIIASILLVSFKGALERARIARGWVFSDSLRASLQADMVAWWPLDMIYAGSPPTTPDMYFNRLDGTVYGATVVEGIVNNALSFNGPASDGVNAGSKYNDGKWHHVVGIYDQANLKLKIFVDGALKQEKDTSITSIEYGANQATFVTIGATTDGKNYPLLGAIDEVRIYSAALPSAVIQQRYAEGLPRHQNIVLSE